MKKQKKMGNKLRAKRKLLGFSMKAISEMVGVSENRISELERGFEKIPSDDLLYKVAEIYKVDELELFNAYGKIPKGLSGIADEIERNADFKETIAGIQESNLSQEEKDNLYKEIKLLYLSALNKCTRGE
ncbi:helix-turn-helix transcriptional regulator [Priestia aryabhattai]|uniref:helix-turn-helix domain-containing protein n=1 Tax=Priestia aryabhattai TaxID=412384 RepID=UPI0028829870|nr:helix-turn-helix transcriptional regulator [Priestia aryabhattai]MDT0150051.1 helix-turn-helix transcriptional regulator [Priestia aryabhattai]MDT0155621.1 helix-turn-helix transcriptional regulator [Priestia aryabhattai]